MNRTQVCLGLTLASLLIVGGQNTKGAQEKKLAQLAVLITDVKDFDKLDGYVLSKKKRKVRIVLGNLLPYSKWPKELAKEEEAIKKDGLKFVKDILANQKMVFWGIDGGDVLHGDLQNWDAQQVGPGPFQYDANKPSGKLGWVTVHVNALILEKGYTVYAPDPVALTFRPTKPRELDRAKLFAEAQDYAFRNKAGLWKLGKDGDFGKKLKEIGKSLTKDK